MQAASETASQLPPQRRSTGMKRPLSPRSCSSMRSCDRTHSPPRFSHSCTSAGIRSHPTDQPAPCNCHSLATPAGEPAPPRTQNSTLNTDGDCRISAGGVLSVAAGAAGAAAAGGAAAATASGAAGGAAASCDAAHAAAAAAAGFNGGAPCATATAAVTACAAAAFATAAAASVCMVGCSAVLLLEAIAVVAAALKITITT